MKALQAPLMILGVFLAASGLAQTASLPDIRSTPNSSTGSNSTQSPAMKRVAAAENQIKEISRSVQAYNELAAALIARSRETSDPLYYARADNVLAQGFRLEPNNFQLRRTRVALLLEEEKYDQAKQQALLLNREVPDDPAVYGYLAESEIALGDYKEAEKSAQWMLNMLPNNVPGLLIGADLRVLYGDPDGAVEFLNQAEAEIPPTEVEELAWIENKVAAVEIETGKTAPAERTLARAQRLFPGYRETLLNLARVRLAQHRGSEAAELLMQVAQIHNDSCVAYDLSIARNAGGAMTASQAGPAMDEKPTASLAGDYDRSEHCVVLMKAVEAGTAGEALQLAERLMAVRHDVWTLDAYAWALYANGQYAKAEATVQRAIDVGIQNAQIFDHAGHIAQRLGLSAEAAKYFELSLRTNPDSPFADDARMQVRSTAASAQTQSPVPSMPLPETAITRTATREVSDAAPPSGASASNLSAPSFPAIPDEWLTPRPTASDRLIRAAQAQVRAAPKSAPALASLGAAYAQRARETANIADFEMAEKSLKTSLQLDSTSFAAAAPLGTLAAVCMGKHRFQDALDFAQQALALGSGDLSPFAIVGDAYADMGDYERATESYARLIPSDKFLSPHEGYVRDSRTSWLKFIAGDTPSAIRLMKAAVAEGTESQIPSENLAWLHFELGEYYTLAGDTAAADAAYRAALSIHHGDYRALASLARLRANHGRYDDAILLYRKAIAVVPMPVFAAELGDVYMKIGNEAEARRAYDLVEYIGRLGQINQVLHNRDLALFYADHDRSLPESLRLARKEFEVRHDIYTWDALAWALYKNAQYEEAYQASQTALRFGTRDPILLYHNGVIAAKVGRSRRAEQSLSAALEINPHFHLIYADAARRSLSSLNVAQLTTLYVDAHER